jgi:hypothetical protein
MEVTMSKPMDVSKLKLDSIDYWIYVEFKGLEGVEWSELILDDHDFPNPIANERKANALISKLRVREDILSLWYMIDRCYAPPLGRQRYIRRREFKMIKQIGECKPSAGWLALEAH